MAALVFVALVPISAIADWKITTVFRSQTGEHAQTEYFKGALRRTDGERFVTVLDVAHSRQIVWAPALQQYVAARYGHVDADRFTNSIVSIDRVTRDTGETQIVFGRAAHHLITQQNYHAANGDSHNTIDGWYLDVDTLPAEKKVNTVHVLAVRSEIPRIEVHKSGPEPKGLAVLLRVESSSNWSEQEITELEETPLPTEVFMPPSTFTRVLHFPGEYHGTWLNELLLGLDAGADWFLTAIGR